MNGCLCMHVCVCMYVYMYVCKYACIHSVLKHVNVPECIQYLTNLLIFVPVEKELCLYQTIILRLFVV